ncbi:hypothetical protein F5B19DRAFT_502929 [Rostrohypoxylon terebratum]|nr:hypothetical protein F5B19DRAFT_502929 [Rostrohypoxylon terebratum]
MASIGAAQSSDTPAAMPGAAELPGSDYTARLEHHNAELKAALDVVRASLEAYQKEAREIRETFEGLKKDAAFAKNHAARIQGEMKNLQKTRRTSQRKRELDETHARVRELEAELQQVRQENADLRQMAQQSHSASDNWRGQYHALQARSVEERNRIAQLEAQNTALGMFSGQQLPVDTPPMDPPFAGLDLDFDLGGDAQASLQDQSQQPGGSMAQPANFDQFGGYGYQQADIAHDPNAYQGAFDDYNFQEL